MKRFLGYHTFYDWLFDWHFPIIFFLMIGPLILTGITQSPIYAITGWIIGLIFSIFCLCYLYVSISHIKFWWKSLFKYKLTNDERIIWERIVEKDKIGYQEWLEQTKGDDLCGHWIKDITPEEVALIDKIHKKYYGDNWWIAVPISTSQVCAVEYWDIKDKIIY